MGALQLEFLKLVVAGWVSRHQQEVIDYLQAESRHLLEQLGGKRLRFTAIADVWRSKPRSSAERDWARSIRS